MYVFYILTLILGVFVKINKGTSFKMKSGSPEEGALKHYHSLRNTPDIPQQEDT